jgi:two-component system response regulator (stage 0 sporulation protein A)
MNTEQKIDAIMRYIVAESRHEKNIAISEIKKIMNESEKTAKRVNVEEEIETILTEIGVPCHIMGYSYTACAVNLVIEDSRNLIDITTQIYPTVAEKYDTKASGVERAIRYAIECAWDRTDIDVIEKYFGNTISITRGKPTNSEFIARIANIVKRRIANG